MTEAFCLIDWIREFEKWAPDIRAVPCTPLSVFTAWFEHQVELIELFLLVLETDHGSKENRKVIEKYELFHYASSIRARLLKAHVIVTTYELVTSVCTVFVFVKRCFG